MNNWKLSEYTYLRLKKLLMTSNEYIFIKDRKLLINILQKYNEKEFSILIQNNNIISNEYRIKILKILENVEKDGRLVSNPWLINNKLDKKLLEALKGYNFYWTIIDNNPFDQNPPKLIIHGELNIDEISNRLGISFVNNPLLEYVKTYSGSLKEE